MPDDRTSRLLDEFSDVTGSAPRPESPARRAVMQQRFPVATLSGASLVIVTIAIAAFVVGRSGPANVAGSSPSPTAPATTAAVSAPASVIAIEPTTGSCDESSLAARITSWEGAAGSRIAHVELTNPGSTPCVLGDRSRPILKDGGGASLIAGKDTTTSHGLVLAPGVMHATLVAVSNYCGPAPVGPVTVAFAFADGGEIVAAPVSPADATVPPCNGAGSPASIDMHAWAP